MNKKWLFYIVLSLFAAVLVSLPHAEQTQATSSDGYIYWGEVQTAQYSPLHAYTLNWSGDVLDRGGMNLSNLTQTTSSSEADIVINQYGAFGARSIVKLNQTDLQERTLVYQQGALSSVTMSKGDVYLITLSDGRYAKVSIDELTTSKVSFSFVVEAEPPAVATPAPTRTPAPTQAPAPTNTPPSKGPAPVPTSAPTVNPTQNPIKNNAEPIILTVGQQQAFVKGQRVVLQQAPIVKNGTTLVPLRFIAESIGAKVDWNNKQQSITLQLNGKTIILVINSKQATINGQRIELPMGPITQNGTTLVPIRFISENFDMEVSYDSVKKQISIMPKGEGTTSTSPTAPPPTASPDKTVTPDSIFGAWKLTSYGHEAGGVAIAEDSTYVHRVMYKGETKGFWRYADIGEVPELSEAIILSDGANRTDWAVGFNADGEFEMYYRYVKSEGGLYGGRVLGWFKDASGTKYSDLPSDVKQIRMTTIEYDYSDYYGNWNLWIEGGNLYIYNTITGQYVDHIYSPGADGGTLTVNANGTYTIKTYAVTQTGTWRAADYNEVSGYEGGIILEAGNGAEAWAMYRTPSGKTALAQDSGSVYTDGSTMWIIQFIVEKR